MACSDYGGYVYRNRKRVPSRSDWVPKPGSPARVTGAERKTAANAFGGPHEGPAGHAVLGTGPFFVSLEKNHCIIVHHGTTPVLRYYGTPRTVPQSGTGIDTTEMQLGGAGGPRLTMIVEADEVRESTFVCAKLIEWKDGEAENIWTGWAAATAGAGWLEGPPEDPITQAARRNTEFYDGRMRELLWTDAENADERLEWNETCARCGGTGLYRGGQEGPGVAVVCHACKGIGGRRRTIEGGRFKSRNELDGVRRVFQCNPGLRLTTETTGGASMEDWENDYTAAARPGAEARESSCPAWWYQTARPSVKPDWTECNETQEFPKCRLFGRKADCWRRFDNEHA